ncbi:MAG: acyl-CoA dehydrogenase family protein, partial [Nitriliruptoraceae bacterium]
ELRPAALEADHRQDPADCFMPDMVRRSSELGLRTLTIPKEYGGGGADVLTEVIVLEELCTGDVGFGMTIQHPWREGRWLAQYLSDEQRERFLPEFMADPLYLTSTAQTEEHWGSDSKHPTTDPADGPRTTAVLDGDEWVINGRKRWISNSNVNRIAFVMARTDTTVPWRQGVSILLVPSDTPGYSIGRVEDKLGIRTNQNAEIILEDCRVPASNLLGPLNGGAELRSRMGAGSGVKEGVKSLGIARAAYETAMDWAHERVQGGGPLIGHQSIALSFGEMAMRIEMVRSLCWRAASYVDTGDPQAGIFESMAMRAAKEAAVDVAVEALEIHGAYGLQRDREVQKLVRDAVSMLHTAEGGHAHKSRLGARLAALR